MYSTNVKKSKKEIKFILLKKIILDCFKFLIFKANNNTTNIISIMLKNFSYLNWIDYYNQVDFRLKLLEI